MTFHNVIMFINSVLNNDRNHYFYYILLEKSSNELPKN